MKKISVILFIILCTNCLYAQSKIIGYFKQLPTELQLGYNIIYTNNKYKVANISTCNVEVDDKNGYLKY